MIKKILIFVILLLVCVYLTAALTTLNCKPQGRACRQVECQIRDSARFAFIHEWEIESILRHHRLYPKGILLDSVVCRRIEDCLQSDPRIENVECYKTPLDGICIEIVQRFPVLRVMNNRGERYLVDSRGSIMPEVPCAVYTVIATGHVSREMACKELYRLGMFLQKDRFWNAQIEQINVTSAKEIELIPRVGNHIIFIGKPGRFEEKLSRLKTFYGKALNKVGWNKYSRISLEFDNQVICTKKEK